jgi:hypothetical protein
MVKTILNMPGAVAYSHNPSYIEDIDQDEHSLKAAQANVSKTPCQPTAGYGESCL